MSRRGLILLLVLIAGLAAVAALIGGFSDQGSDEGPGDGRLLFPALAGSINDVSGIVVRGAGDRVVATLERGNDRWTLAERNGYPADVGRIRRNLLALAEAEVVEEKTSNPEFYDRLAVQDVSSDSARGIQLELSGPTPPVRVIIGDTGIGEGRMAYVRIPGEAQSWLVDGSFDPGRATADWLDREVIDIPATRIRAVTITHPDAPPLHIERMSAEDEDFTVHDVPAGRSLSFAGAANAIGAVLAALRLEDVQPWPSTELASGGASGDASGGAAGDANSRPVVARFVTFDGLVVEASAWRVPDGTRVSFQASSDAAADPAPAEAVIREAEALNVRLGGWAYTLPAYKVEQLTRRTTDLLAPKDVAPN